MTLTKVNRLAMHCQGSRVAGMASAYIGRTAGANYWKDEPCGLSS